MRTSAQRSRLVRCLERRAATTKSAAHAPTPANIQAVKACSSNGPNVNTTGFITPLHRHKFSAGSGVLPQIEALCTAALCDVHSSPTSVFVGAALTRCDAICDKLKASLSLLCMPAIGAGNTCYTTPHSDRHAASTGRGCPCSMIAPLRSTMIRSAERTVESRCAIKIEVLRAKSSSALAHLLFPSA